MFSLFAAPKFGIRRRQPAERGGDDVDALAEHFFEQGRAFVGGVQLEADLLAALA